ncbi:MAG: hypothetical protein R3250_15195, partial [Melioribacteraceae bacterium]|nr:hypothetical protein [Melioribacteraceae bacterium]
MKNRKKHLVFLFFVLVSFFAKGQYSYIIKHSVEFYGSNALYDISASGLGLLTEIGDNNGLSSSGQIVFTSNTKITEVFVTLRTDNCGIRRISIPISTPRCNLSEEYTSNCADEIDIIYFGFFEVIKPDLIPDSNNDLNSRDICDSQEFLISNLENSCTRVSYAVDYFIGSSTTPRELLKYQPRSEYFSFIPSNIPGLKPKDLLRIQVRYTEDFHANKSETSPEVQFNVIDCSPNLINEPVTTNETCYGTNDGAVTLTFDSNVDSEQGYEMRYFIYQGDPPENPAPVEMESDNPTFPNQTFADPRGINMEPIADGSGNYSGTFTGLDGSSALDNGNTILDHADYFIIYQEVRYDFPNPGDV